MRVVNRRKESFTHYIGRPSKLGNPFTVGKDGGRGFVLVLYENYARDNPAVLMEISKLPEDAVLGCYCKPKDCHGDVIVKLWKEIREGRIKVWQVTLESRESREQEQDREPAEKGEVKDAR